MNSAYIDLAIGLALAFFLLSLLVSAANEAIVRILGVRAKFLWASIRDLLDSPKLVGSTLESRTPVAVMDIATFIFKPDRDARPDFVESPPSVAATEFTKASTVGSQSILTDALYERISSIDFASRRVPARNGRRLTTKKKKTTISQIPPQRLALAVMEVLEGRYADKVDDFVKELKESGSPFHSQLAALWAEAKGDKEKLKAGLESWFDNEMTRLTAVYRRHTRWIIGVIALGITLFMGFDAVNYAGSLLDDQARREQIVAATTSGKDKQLQQLCGYPDKSKSEVDTVACYSEVIGQPALADAFNTSLLSFKTVETTSKASDGKVGMSPNGAAWWNQVANTAHWPGFALTVLALLFGAPFWWDVLRRLMGMRTRRPTRSDSS